MSVSYNSLHVDEKYAAILEPNLYYGSIFVPGVTCTDKYQTGPAGGIFVHKLATSACTVGTPGRDFSDEATQDDLIQIVLNNNYQKSKKIYGVQAAAVGIALGNEALATAIKEVDEGRQLSGIACLIHEGTAATDTTAINTSTAKHEIIAVRKEITNAKGRADTVICSPDFYAILLEAAGDKFEPVRNDRIAATGNVGSWLGFNIIEANAAAAASGEYYDYAGALQTVDFSNLDFIMYNSQALSIIPNFESARIIDSENFTGSKAQVEVNAGLRVTNSTLVRVRKHAAAQG